MPRAAPLPILWEVFGNNRNSVLSRPRIMCAPARACRFALFTHPGGGCAIDPPGDSLHPPPVFYFRGGKLALGGGLVACISPGDPLPLFPV